MKWPLWLLKEGVPRLFPITLGCVYYVITILIISLIIISLIILISISNNMITWRGLQYKVTQMSPTDRVEWWFDVDEEERAEATASLQYINIGLCTSFCVQKRFDPRNRSIKIRMTSWVRNPFERIRIERSLSWVCPEKSSDFLLYIFIWRRNRGNIETNRDQRPTTNEAFYVSNSQ